jgi:drug/metabolite transporter (DMT)-like permease
MATWQRKFVDVGLVILVNGIGAGQYAVYKTATEAMGPITVSAWTFLLTSVVLVPLLLREKGRSSSLNSPANQSKPSFPTSRLGTWSKQDITGFVVGGVFGLIPASAFLAWGTMRSTASNAAIIYLTIPIITAELASLILGEKMTRARWLSLFVSLSGVLILSDIDWRPLNLIPCRYLLLNVLVLLACISRSFFNIYSKGLLRRFSPLEVLVLGDVTAVVISLPLRIWVEPLTIVQIRRYTATTWASVMVLGVFSWRIAMVLWMFLLKRLDVSQTSVSVYLRVISGTWVTEVGVGVAFAKFSPQISGLAD